MKPMMKPTKKRMKFRDGDAVPGFESPERQKLLERARRFVEARDDSDMSPRQAALLRAQPGREYGSRGEEQQMSEAMKRVISAAQERDRARRMAENEEASSRADMRSRMSRESAEAPPVERRAEAAPVVSRETPISRPPDYDARIRAQAIEPVAPETFLGGAGALRAALTGARGLATRGVQKAEEAATKAFSRPQAREVRESEAVKRARSAKERRDAANEARRRRDTERMEGESLGPVRPRSNPKRESPPPRDMDEMRMAGEGFGFKRGGTAKFAKGGAVSARADGIAQRGKTTCKIY